MTALLYRIALPCEVHITTCVSISLALQQCKERLQSCKKKTNLTNCSGLISGF